MKDEKRGGTGYEDRYRVQGTKYHIESTAYLVQGANYGVPRMP